MYEKMNELANTMNGKIIGMVKEFHDDQYIVIGEFADNYEKYVVWNYNPEFNGFYQGFYCQKYSSAMNEMKRRLG